PGTGPPPPPTHRYRPATRRAASPASTCSSTSRRSLWPLASSPRSTGSAARRSPIRRSPRPPGPRRAPSSTQIGSLFAFCLHFLRALAPFFFLHFLSAAPRWPVGPGAPGELGVVGGGTGSAANFWIRLLARSATYRAPAESVPTPAGALNSPPRVPVEPAKQSCATVQSSNPGPPSTPFPQVLMK